MASRSTTLSEVNVAYLTEEFGSFLIIEDEWIRFPRRALGFSDEDDMITIPRNRNSLATLRFLGLSKEAAHATWERYQTSVLFDVDDIINFAKAKVRAGQDTDSVDDTEWIAAMRTMGASKDLRTRIMTPGHEDIRMLKTPMAWVVQTMKESWAELEHMNYYVQVRGRGKVLSRSATLEARQGNKEGHLVIESVVQDRTAKADEIHVFKGGAYGRLMKAFRKEKLPAQKLPGPRFHTLNVASLPPTHFSQGRESTYWTKHLELAEKFARYAQIRDASVRCGMLHMIVPKSIIESAVQFRETAHWQEFVFVNSLEMPVPVHLAYLKHADVLIGPMVYESRDQILRRTLNGDDFTTMQATKLASGQKAMQISFKGEKMHDRLNVEARLWLEELVAPKSPQKKSIE